MQSFQEIPLVPQILRAVEREGYDTPTPIQAQAIPPLLEERDLLGCAQTGTGKTAAFALPILHRLSESTTPGAKRAIRALVLTPTRELAAQIDESFRAYGRFLALKTTVVFGGVGRSPQEKKLKAGVDILVATPGRLLDLIGTGHVNLKQLEVFVLDEADRMLDMGFIHDVRKVIERLPAQRQSLFFSATMPKTVADLANSLLHNPVKVEVAPQATPAERIRQSVLFVDKSRKDKLLHETLSNNEMERVLVFTRTKHRASRVARKLMQHQIAADAIHGDKAQNARTKALGDFRSGKVRVLVATDIAARGIDIDNVTHVINYEIPNEPESYVHRIGRTARAGNEGEALSFCAGDERDYLKAIEKAMRRRIDIHREHSYHSEDAEQGLVDGVDGAVIRKKNAPGQARRNASSAPKKGPGKKKGSAQGRGKTQDRSRADHAKQSHEKKRGQGKPAGANARKKRGRRGRRGGRPTARAGE